MATARTLAPQSLVDLLQHGGRQFEQKPLRKGVVSVFGEHVRFPFVQADIKRIFGLFRLKRIPIAARLKLSIIYNKMRHISRKNAVTVAI